MYIHKYTPHNHIVMWIKSILLERGDVEEKKVSHSSLVLFYYQVMWWGKKCDETLNFQKGCFTFKT